MLSRESEEVRAAAESVFYREHGRLLAGLIRICGSFDRAEEALQEGFTAALTQWPEKGLPQNPGAWIMAVGHRKLIDAARRERTRREHQNALQYEMEACGPVLEPLTEATMTELPDDRLRLIFTCCHPALNREAQVALTLRTLGGLSTREIAKAFLIPEPALAQRLVRAKRKIQQARIPYETPAPHRLRERLGAVRSVVYLIFNEGYATAAGRELVRGDLCREAIRLGRLLCALLPDEPENLGLLALFLLQDSRRNARVADQKLITLEQQDRALWDRAAIAEGCALLEQALRCGPAGPYQLQAAIAASHAQAKTSAETDWPQIAALYGKLSEWDDSPVIALNQAVAVAMGGALEEGLRRIDDLRESGLPGRYYLFHAARADLLRRLERLHEAAQEYREAIGLTANEMEIAFLQGRLEELGYIL